MVEIVAIVTAFAVFPWPIALGLVVAAVILSSLFLY